MDRAILAVCPSWGAPDAASSVLASRHAERLAALSDRLAPFGGSVLASDGELVVVGIPSAHDALIAALDQAYAEPHAVIGLGWADDASASDAARARRLAWRAAPGVRGTAAFRAALGTPPPGVGLHRTPHDVEHRLGFDAFDLADHRR